MEFCTYVTKNTIDTNSDNISILEDDIPFKRLIILEIKEILKIFEDIIDKIFKKITNKIEETIKKTNVLELTPMEAINLLYELKKKTKS